MLAMPPALTLALSSAQAHDQLYLCPMLEAAGHRLRRVPSVVEPEHARALDGCDGLISFVGDRLDAPLLNALAAGTIRVIVQRAAGIDNIDLAAARAAGIAIANVPAYSPESVAEHALALLLCLARNLPRSIAQVRRRDFRLEGLLGFRVHGKTVGIVGLGRIGTAFARIMHGLGCRVIACGSRCVDGAGVTGVDPDTLWRESDIVSLHCPLTPTTHHMVDAARLAQARPGGLLINTARGGLVDTGAVLDALDSGRLQRYGADVYENERCIFFRDCGASGFDDPVLERLLRHPAALLTPHQGFFTHEALQEIAVSVTRSIDAYARGRTTPDFIGSGTVP